ncbi:hypothetical protein RJG79_04875 [Mycoplasmatota bacterium WC44]
MNSILHIILSINWNIVIVFALLIVLGILLKGSPTKHSKNVYWQVEDEEFRKNNMKNKGKKIK